MYDLLLAENVSKQDARKLQSYWGQSRTYLEAAFGRGKWKHRSSVWLQR